MTPYTAHCLVVFARAFAITSVTIGTLFLLAWAVGSMLKHVGRAEFYPPKDDER